MVLPHPMSKYCPQSVFLFSWQLKFHAWLLETSNTAIRNNENCLELHIFSSYRAGNTPGLGYKDKPINVLWENNPSFIQQDRKCTYNVMFEVRLRNNCCRGKAISITYSQLVFVALVIQHAKPMRIIILSSVASPTLPYFSTYLLKDTIFRKKSYWTQNCVLIFSTTFAWNIMKRIQRDIIINVH
jgi:hypothetical protein